jgi:branched-chain amino acid transport system ATP-binding protein
MLDVAGVHTYYGESHVLHGVSLEVRPGEAVALLGRNGVGKTTLIRTVVGFTPPREGTVRYEGRDLHRLPPYSIARAGLALVPQGRRIFAPLSVTENLELGERRGPWTAARIHEIFPRLRERGVQSGGTLSGGEQQMLAIGRALMTNPQLLILDEATEGLAPLVVIEIWRVVSAIRETGIATLIVDRNYRAVLAHTDRAVVMEKGRITMQGASATLAASPETLAGVLGV